MVKNQAANAGAMGLVSESGRSPGGGNGNALQYSCLGNPMDRGVWRAAVLGVTKELDILEQLSTHTYRGIYRCSNVYKGKNTTRYLYIN